MSLENRIKQIQHKITLAEKKAGREPGYVKLIAVSKTFSAGVIRQAFEFGQTQFAENYAKEALEKKEELSGYNIQWHFIGHLQSNKVKLIANQFSLIHSVDSLSLLNEIDKRSNEKQNILLQVNLAGETSKSGCDLSDLPSLIQNAQTKKNIQLHGLMFMAPLSLMGQELVNFYKKATQLRDKMASQVSAPHSLVELSMGTSHDFEVAIEEGATMVRLGSILFGERSKSWR